MTAALLDANVLIEILMKRDKLALCEDMLRDETKVYVISALTVHIVRYISEKHHLIHEDVVAVLAPYGLLPLTEQVVVVANTRYDGKDFEDCLQAACAELGNCDEIITLDKNFKRRSGTKLPVTVVE